MGKLLAFTSPARLFNTDRTLDPLWKFDDVIFRIVLTADFFRS